MKRYTLEVIINEGNDEFWEQIKGTGCDEVVEAIDGALFNHGWGNDDDSPIVTLKKFEDF